MALISLDQIFLPLRYVSGSGTIEFATDNNKSASFTPIQWTGGHSKAYLYVTYISRRIRVYTQ